MTSSKRELLMRVSDWRDDWPEPREQDCRGCEQPTTATCDALIGGTVRVQVPICFGCWQSIPTPAPVSSEPAGGGVGRRLAHAMPGNDEIREAWREAVGNAAMRALPVSTVMLRAFLICLVAPAASPAPADGDGLMAEGCRESAAQDVAMAEAGMLTAAALSELLTSEPAVEALAKHLATELTLPGERAPSSLFPGDRARARRALAAVAARLSSPYPTDDGGGDDGER